MSSLAEGETSTLNQVEFLLLHELKHVFIRPVDAWNIINNQYMEGRGGGETDKGGREEGGRERGRKERIH